MSLKASRLFLLVTAVFLVGNLNSISLAQSDLTILAPGVPIERELKGGEIHSYRVTLKEGQYLLVTVEQIGIDVIVKVRGPNDRQTVEVNNWKELRHEELLSLIAKSSGEYHLEVRAAERDAIAGRYALTIKVLGATTAEDRKRIAAEKLFIEAEQLHAQSTTESRQQAIEKYKEALSGWEGLGDQSKQAETIFQIATVFKELVENRKALDYFDRALALAQAAGDKREQARLLEFIGDLSTQLGEHQKVLEYYSQALALAGAVGDRLEEATILNRIGEFYFFISDQRKAQEYYEKALVLCRATGDRSRETETLIDIGVSYRALGEPQTALQYYNQALPFIAPSDRGARGFLLQSIGSVYYDLGEMEKSA